MFNESSSGDSSEIAALKAKYKAEREKRLTAERAVPLQLTGSLARYLDDPYSRPKQRSPLASDSEVVIVGAGLGGLMIAAELKRRGVEDVRLIDAAGDVGGVWYWNRYPGARCDIDALVYLPYLEEIGTKPTEKYAKASEILGHAQAIAKQFGLYDKALLQTSVTGASWDHMERRWEVTTDRGDQLRSRFLVLANGPLQKLKLPAVPGLDSFTGAAFHTSRWDYEYTGGTSDTELSKLTDKVVGVLGTGATAIQCIPPLARSAKQLYVFQRTPSTVAPRNNKPIDQRWLASLPAGWQEERRQNFTASIFGPRPAVDLVNDGWTDLFRALGAAEVDSAEHDPVPLDDGHIGPEEAPARKEAADFRRMEAIRARIDDIIDDPDTASSLKPYYAYLCKRPGFSDEYLQAFNRPNVTLIDTNGRGVGEIRSDGIVIEGRLIQLDCIVFATGFETGTSYTHRIGFDVIGRAGNRLSEKWANGISSLHGMMTSEFPNLLVQPGLSAQSTETPNLVHTMLENARHMSYIISEVRRHAEIFELADWAEKEWVELIIEKAPDDTEFLRSCTPGRKNIEGDPESRPLGDRNYGGGPLALYEELRSWRARGDLRGLDLR
ncbi:flavin-containing monooxygenase [Nocardia vinacea]|uniref:flavin-containing monooxygenase n=1 Tax=Nocardia vinacea TaxID=96468 RepID=UPI000301B359|nr:NAD(P)/FAD-dependent oxidoreductase [Nocardia vinacea]